jgi:hypothetical protein
VTPTPNLRQIANRTVLVAIPALFGNTEARACRIVAAEGFGVWLVSEELAARVMPHAHRQRDTSAVPQPIFVPFAQIAAIVPMAPAASTTSGLQPASASGAAASVTAAAAAASVAGATAAPSAATASPRAGGARGNPDAPSRTATTSGSAGA